MLKHLMLLTLIVLSILSFNYNIEITLAQDTSLPANTTETTNTTKTWWQNLADTVTGFFKGIADFVNKLKDLGKFIWESLEFAGKALSYAVNALTHIGDAFSYLFSWFGNWGNPEEYNKLMLNSLSFPALRQAISDCSLNKTTIYTTRMLGINNEDKNFCTYLAEVAPTGFLGYIHYMIYAMEAGGKVVTFIVKNFLYVISAVSIFILVVGLEQSVKKKDVTPLMNSLNIVWKILTFPAKAIWWVVNLFIKLIQMIAQFISAIKPV